MLEIGLGTGQATRDFAARGCSIVAVERGARLAERACDELAGFPNVEVVTSSFEEWPLPDEGFDCVLAATSFHWLDPAVRVTKSAAALRPGGVLATIATSISRGQVGVLRCVTGLLRTLGPGHGGGFAPARGGGGHGRP